MLDAALKITNVSLDLISDPTMYLMIERGIRGGVSCIAPMHSFLVGSCSFSSRSF